MRQRATPSEVGEGAGPEAGTAHAHALSMHRTCPVLCAAHPALHRSSGSTSVPSTSCAISASFSASFTAASPTTSCLASASSAAAAAASASVASPTISTSTAFSAAALSSSSSSAAAADTRASAPISAAATSSSSAVPSSLAPSSSLALAENPTDLPPEAGGVGARGTQAGSLEMEVTRGGPRRSPSCSCGSDPSVAIRRPSVGRRIRARRCAGPVGATSCFAAAPSITSAASTCVGGKSSAPRMACGSWEAGGAGLRRWEVGGVASASDCGASAGGTSAALAVAEASAASPASESWYRW